MMREGVCIFASLIFCVNVCSCIQNSTSDVVVEAKAEKEDRVKVVPLDRSFWGSDGELFRSYFLPVQRGWTRDEVLSYLGEPDYEEADEWSYTWEEYPGEGGEYAEYSLVFDGDVLQTVNVGAGHLQRRYR